MSDVRQRVDTRNGVHLNGAPKGSDLASQGSTALQQQITALTQKVEQMDLNHQIQLHDLQSGNRDLVVGVQALQGLQPVVGFLTPLIQTGMSEGMEGMITKNADGHQFEFEILIENGED